MGQVVDGDIGLDTKSSPRKIAIEKAQAELRQEFDVREERKRELEFLEKGGNPLDFKFSPLTSVSVQSTSLTDQLREYEAKGSFVFVNTQGDSTESNGHPGAPLVREPNFADNLLFFKGGNNALDEDKNGKNTCKRKSDASPPHSLRSDGSRNAKETEDPFILHLGVKRQAYARRNRSKSSQDGSHVRGTDHTQSSHGTQASTLPSSQSDTDDGRILVFEVQKDENNTVCNSKGTSLCDKHESKNVDSGDKMDIVLDAVQGHKAFVDPAPLHQDSANVRISKEVHETNNKEQLSFDVSERDHNVEVPLLVGKGEETVSADICPPTYEKCTHSASIHKSSDNGIGNIDNMKDLQDADQTSENCATFSGKDVSTLQSSAAQAVVPNNNRDIDENGPSGPDDCYVLGKSSDACMEDIKEEKTASEGSLTPDTNVVRVNKSMETTGSSPAESGGQKSSLFVSSLNVEVKNEECFDDKIDARDEPRSASVIENKQEGRISSNVETKIDCSFPGTCGAYGDTSCLLNAKKCNLIPSKIECSEVSHSVRSCVELQTNKGNNLKSTKSCEDAILNEARIIEGKLKRAKELPLCNSFLLKQHKSHWDYVLEEMAWLANDFMQERLWRLTAAAQICHKIAARGKLKFEESNLCQKQKAVSLSLANAIIKFWSSVKENKNINGEDLALSRQLPILCYAVKFLQSDCFSKAVLAEAPQTPDRTSDSGSSEMLWEQECSYKDILYYKIPFGAAQVYRESVESHHLPREKKCRSVHQLDTNVSVAGTVPEIKNHEVMEEDEGATTMYYISEGQRASNFSHPKKNTLLQRTGASRSSDVGDFSYALGTESKLEPQSSSLSDKRHPNTLIVGSIPTKRVRTAARQRVVSPYSTSAAGTFQVTNKTDASSGDTNSFQDDQSSLQGVSYLKKSSEFESTVDFVKQLPVDGAEFSTKPKRKKSKYLGHKISNATDCGGFDPAKGSSCEQRWPITSGAQVEQKAISRKQIENNYSEYNGTNGGYVQPALKKPKILKLRLETPPEAVAPPSGPIPSPVASQMSNMSNSNKLIKVIPNRDRSKKSKALKPSAGQSGPGSGWSLFEDQTLVVLVHDMGPNWELISDAMNNSVQFKSIFRKPKECKERHKFLMDKNAGDGADSADDSGSSQPYPSTLPGIPKGSARQLFQRLQGPMEEDTLKAHFEKIIHIGQKLHSCLVQKDNVDQKPTSTVHSSHILALSQANPNYLSTGPPTPLDLCDATSNIDTIPLAYEGAHANCVALPGHQGSAALTMQASSASNMVQGSPSMVIGSSFSSPSAALNASRDPARYGIPRSTSAPVDDQQRMQYGQVVSGRNFPGGLHVGSDRSVRVLPGANGMGMMNGGRGMPVARTGFQGMAPPGMLGTSGSVLSSTGVGMPSLVNASSSSGHGQGNSIIRLRDSLQIPRAGQNPDDHRQVMQDHQVQGTQTNGQMVAPYSGISSTFSNQTVPSPSVQTFPVQQRQMTHQMSQHQHLLGNPHRAHIQGTNRSSSQQQAFSMRMAKERHLQQRLIQQQPPSSNNTASPLPISSQLQQKPQTTPSTAPISSSHAQYKQQTVSRNNQANANVPNQMIKQRQRQQIQQQPSQQSQLTLQQAKLMKSGGRGSPLMHQSSSIDASHVNGSSSTSENQILDKQVTQHNQPIFCSNSASNSSSSPTSSQQKSYPRQSPQPLKQVPKVPSHADNSNVGQVQVHSSQAPAPSLLPLASQNQQLRHLNQSHQTMHKFIIHQNNHLRPDGHTRTSDNMEVDHVTATPTQCTDVANSVPDTRPGPPSTSQWQPEPSFQVNTLSPISHLSGSQQQNVVGGESPSSEVLPQRPSTNHLLHGHNKGGHWQQKQQLQTQQPLMQQQTHPSHQQLHRQAGQSMIHGHSSNPSPG